MSELSDIKKDLEILKKQIDKAAKTMDSEASEEIKGKIDLLRSEFDTFLERSKEASKKIKSYAEEHPWQSIGISMLAGLLVGFMLRQSMKDKDED